MFDRFTANFRVVSGGTEPKRPWRDPRLIAANGYLELAESSAGLTFEGGLYRLHDATSGPRGDALITECFPDFVSRASPFGVDWLGRQFALDERRIEHGQRQVLLLEPGTGEVLELPFSFHDFHEQLIDIREPALAVSFFAEWARENAALLPLRRSECVGYKVPLFLGGRDDLDNLEVVDLEVYWSICGQLRLGTRAMAADSSIRKISVGE
jgi:hypothetical protein